MTQVTTPDSNMQMRNWGERGDFPSSEFPMFRRFLLTEKRKEIAEMERKRERKDEDKSESARESI